MEVPESRVTPPPIPFFLFCFYERKDIYVIISKASRETTIAGDPHEEEGVK